MSPLLLVGWLSAVGSATLLLLARRAARRRTEHVLRACHELRGPLQNVSLAVGATTEAGVAGRSTLGPLAVELARASRAVDDLAAVAVGGHVRDERRHVELAPLVRDLVAVHDLAARARGRRVELGDVDAVASVVGDRARLTQAIGNLMANAVEHGAGTVRVAVGRDGGQVHVVVADEGHGLQVPIADLLHGRARGQRGRGMRIVADALISHGGRLRAGSTATGARMIAELPPAGPRSLPDLPGRTPRTAAS